MTNLREYQKALYQVRITRAPAGLCIYNHLDNSNCMTNEDRQFVVTGLQGEQWPIKAKDVKKYLNLDGSVIDIDTWEIGETKTVKTNTNGPHILAYIATEREEFPAPASWGMTEPLVANPGDAIAYTKREDGTPDPEDKYVIDATVFGRTYEEVL